MFPLIQNETLKKECIWIRIRGAFPAKKAVPKLSFHREGGKCPHLPPKSATARYATFLVADIHIGKNARAKLWQNSMFIFKPDIWECLVRFKSAALISKVRIIVSLQQQH